MDTSVYTLEFRDFVEMERALSAWDHRYRQIGPGAFRGSLVLTQTGSLGIFRNRWERAIHYRGTPPQGTLALGLSLTQIGDARWMGQRVGLDDVIIQRCGTEAEYLSAPLWDSVVFTLPVADLASLIAALTDDDPGTVLTHSVVRLAPGAAAQLRQAGLAYFDRAARSQATPDTPSALPQMAQWLVELIARALVAAQHRHSKKRAPQRLPLQVISKVEAYCSHLRDKPVRIARLCSEIGVSERSLRDTFHKLTAMSPLTYIKAMQLNRVYRVLRDADRSEVLVKQVALSNGFTHFGQFSRDYKQLFGELPSETLGRGSRMHERRAI